MMRINLVLLLAVVLSSLVLVNLQYESRHLYAELDRANAQATRLASESERLQVEKRAQATSARVERLAKEQLQMRAATPAVTTYVSWTSATSAPDLAQARVAATAASGRMP
ncbi:cell division protein FtsL [Rhodoferax sp.]|uniref:cell division protein FtsL n=1 Tax=Rhodoferax sp. TaxID=50421 RepID=UPI00260881A8|nr:cell division protein FtsL [Rhodoferax sp.]MDD2811332.1 cell division protein FtsL [Rhodoferax sp.]MDD4942066.1 cell division protein FtsL [Rhodoferax sp.]MDD5480884.1 cell division protein FtsL [Rhodoferax sp.]